MSEIDKAVIANIVLMFLLFIIPISGFIMGYFQRKKLKKEISERKCILNE